MNELPRALRWYLWSVYTVSVAYIAASTLALLPRMGGAVPDQWFSGSKAIYLLLFVAMSFLGEQTSVQVTGGISQSLSTSVHVGAILLFPPPLPLLVTLAGVAVSQVPDK